MSNCVKCPLKEYTNDGDDCPFWDSNHEKAFDKTITFTINKRAEDE